MATIGQSLTAPEKGWKRVDDSALEITYSGAWNTVSNAVFYYNGICHASNEVDAKAQFNFSGSKLRIIGNHFKNKSTSVDVYIDGTKTGNFSQYMSGDVGMYCVLEFETTDLGDGEHYVTIVNNATGGYGGNFIFDAIDIDEAGKILPYNPDEKADKALLKVTMSDSSEREYKATQTEVNKFIQWINGAGRTGDNCYKFDDVIDGSKEYLIFEKIISFKVFELK
ncbi:MAG: hypothetical protein H6Q70_1889 [Firmicutes bacterium]|nr:hypothetical protein [Bacillota bacterium]